MNSKTDIQKVADALSKANSVAVLTGAGVSAESGIPTFRDALTGLWSKFNAEELATPEGFIKNPELVWKWYYSRRMKNAACKPNSGHFALAKMESLIHDFTLITQNVDGLHQAAGSKNVVELHGSLQQFVCFDNNHRIDDGVVDSSPERPPICKICGSMARPGVVWFGEFLPEAAVYTSLKAIERADILLVIGTSGQVQPAASFGLAAQKNGATVVVINPDASARIGNSFFLQGNAGEIVPELVSRAWPE
ncbi:MAG: SIR2 family NAD-dependent protein deacylase [bacterium]